MQANGSRMVKVSPILTMYDISRAEAFYSDKFGFSIVAKYPDLGYLIVSRDEVELHFNMAQSGTSETTMTECYIYVDGVEGLYTEAESQGIVHPNGRLESKPWGMREFAVRDSEGNLLRIGGEDTS
ncbi:MAG: bleomycin resistance protein [Chloroflexota bacterium]